MSITLLEKTGLNEAQQAAIGRFFNVPFAGDLEGLTLTRGFDQDFWLRHQDLLNDNAGVVFQAGIASGGRLVGIGKDKVNDHVSLSFDGSGYQSGKYLWQFTLANLESGRKMIQLMGSVGVFARYDSQGRQAGVQFLDEEQGAQSWHLVESIVRSPMFRDNVAVLRERKDAAERELQAFAVDGLLRYKRTAYYEKELAKREEHIKQIGFVAIKPSALWPSLQKN
jgi:hypothetical protein